MNPSLSAASGAAIAESHRRLTMAGGGQASGKDRLWPPGYGVTTQDPNLTKSYAERAFAAMGERLCLPRNAMPVRRELTERTKGAFQTKQITRQPL